VKLSPILLAFLIAVCPLAGCSKDKKDKQESPDAGRDAKPPSAAECEPCESGTFCFAGACRETGGEVVAGSVGHGDKEFAVTDLSEAQSEAPQALAVANDSGLVYVLDQLNQRVSVFAEGLERSFSIESSTAEEIALLGSGLVVVRDRYADEFRVYDLDGEVLERSPVSGVGLASVAYAGPLYTRDNGVWMNASTHYVHVLDALGAPVKRRRVLPGLPSPDLETLLTVKLLNDGTLHVISRPILGEANYTQQQLRFDNPVLSLLAHDIDAQGRIFLATEHWLQTDSDEVATELLLSVLSPQLEVERQEELPQSSSARSVSRRMAVSRSGSAFYLNVEEDRISVLGY
jgi:hypothetical protein